MCTTSPVDFDESFLNFAGLSLMSVNVHVTLGFSSDNFTTFFTLQTYRKAFGVYLVCATSTTVLMNH